MEGTKSLNILISVNSAWNVWNFRRPVVESLIADGHRVSVLAPPDGTVGKLEGLGCRFRPLEMSVKGLNPALDLAFLARLRRIFQDERPDIVLSYTIKNSIFGAMAAKSIGVPFVPNVSGLGTAFLSGGALERIAVRLYKTAFRDLPIVFFQNDEDRDLFVARDMVQPGQARLLPGSGIDLERFAARDYPAAGSRPVFLMIARLLRDKGVLEYVDAARIVTSARPDVRFQLLGATDAENRTAIDRATVQGWEDDGLIDYLGTVEDVRPVIEAAHCVVLPSYREGAPRTLIEAAALARPVIATDVPGCRAVVDEGQTGFLCELRSAQSFAAACYRFLDLGYDAQVAMGRAGRVKMEQEYDQRIVIEAYQAAIDDLVGGGRGRT